MLCTGFDAAYIESPLALVELAQNCSDSTVTARSRLALP